MTEQKTTTKSAAKTFSKDALVDYFTGLDKSIAKIVLPDKPQTIKQAEDTLAKWKKEEAK